MGPEVIVPVSGMIMILGICLGIPLVRSYTKRMDMKPRDSLPNGEVIARLDRIEQAIEAVSTEVERIAEGQRFTTKLLSADNRSSGTAAIASAPATAPKEPAPPQGTILVEAARRT